MPAPKFATSQDDIRQVSETIAASLATEEKEPEDFTVEVEKFEIGEIPVTEPLEDRIFQRHKDSLVREVAESGEPFQREALIQTYKTLPESLWDSNAARTLYNANLQLKGQNG